MVRTWSSDVALSWLYFAHNSSEHTSQLLPSGCEAIEDVQVHHCIVATIAMPPHLNKQNGRFLVQLWSTTILLGT